MPSPHRAGSIGKKDPDQFFIKNMRNMRTGLLMKTLSCTLMLAAILFFTSCSIGKSSLSSAKKFSLADVQKDYSVFQGLLEESHPSLYWYTPKDSMDHYFHDGYKRLKDSMTETDFRKVLAYVSARVNCGHTSIRPSKAYSSTIDSTRLKVFPLSLKIWDDTAVVAANLIRKDSVLTRGTVVKKINGKEITEIVDTLSKYISADGYNQTHKWQSLSNRGYFGSLYTSLFGLSSKYNIEYIDSTGRFSSTSIPVYNPLADSNNFTRTNLSARRGSGLSKKDSKQLQLRAARSLRFDSVHPVAFIDLNTFSRGSQIKKFLRSSFRSFQKNKTKHLVIDVRGNGGGTVTNSTALTRYLAKEPFKVADSLYAIKRKSKYGQYIENDFFNRLFMSLFSQRKKDGYYHFGYFERHYFKPKKKNHFDGMVYIITGGNSFSATTLFVTTVMKQENVIIVGEETGGGAYGNSAWLIPEVTLPQTGVRFRLPLFRLVIDKNIPKDGRGVLPEIESKPTTEAIRKGRDFKMDKVMELIREDKRIRN